MKNKTLIIAAVLSFGLETWNFGFGPDSYRDWGLGLGACSAQNVGISATGVVPNASAGLDIDFNDKGLLIPRLTTAQATTLASTAAEGLMIYNITTKCFQVFNIAWQNMFCVCTSAPATPGSITGTTSVCENATGEPYSITAVTGATSYTWTTPAGATITSGQGTKSILVNFGSSSGNISVTATNSCGTSAASSLAITITASPTTANAGPDQNLPCGATSTTLAGNTPGVGTGLWTIVSGTGGSFTDATSPTTSFSGTPGTTYILRWTISNSPCAASYDEVSIISCITDDAYTVLKLHMNGINGSTTFTDNSPVTPHTVTANNGAQISNVQAKFCQSGLFDGTDDYLTIVDDGDFDFPDDYTIDLWFKISSSLGGTLYAHHQAGVANHGLFINRTLAGVLTIQDDINGIYVECGSGLNNDIWHHVAWVRSGTGADNNKIFVDGIVIAQFTATSAININDNIGIGFYINNNSNYFNGYLDELRISKGVARWSGPFTPPASPYCD